MYDSYINNEVVVIVYSRIEYLWEYTGFLSKADEEFLKLKNVEIN